MLIVQTYVARSIAGTSLYVGSATTAAFRHEPGRTERSAMSLSFQTDILPLFTSMDIEHMSALGAFLDEYSFMSQPHNASLVYDVVSSGKMPPSTSGEPRWSQEKVQLFKAWIDGGYTP